MGATWVDADHFRFGASGLLGSLLETLGPTSSNQPSGDGTPAGDY